MVQAPSVDLGASYPLFWEGQKKEWSVFTNNTHKQTHPKRLLLSHVPSPRPSGESWGNRNGAHSPAGVSQKALQRGAGPPLLAVL